MNAIPSAILPRNAGPVALNFSEAIDRPRRESRTGRWTNELSFPIRQGMELFPLKGGEQFLLIYPPNRDQNLPDEAAIFFGMDESAFLVGVQDPAVNAFRTGGEEAFFHHLKPGIIKQLETLFPKMKAARQGDIWSFKLPFTWTELVAYRIIRRKEYREEVKRLRLSETKLFGTNHILWGKYLPKSQLAFAGAEMMKAAIAEGTLTAPDHAPQTLDGPHVVAQTPHLAPATRERFDLGFEPRQRAPIVRW